jgi:hypothetical protein
MKYRLLSNEELSALEEDLKAFLIINGIDGSTWENINKTEPQKAIGLVGLFSDSVLQKVYEKIKFLEFRASKTCIVFHCTENEIELISLYLNKDSVGDFSTPENIHQTLINYPTEILASKQSQSYKKSREEDIHQLIEQGCVPSVKDFWVSLIEIIE